MQFAPLPTNFDPSGVAANNGNFIGLPFTEETANIILFPVPWEVTVSYRAGTARAWDNILNASFQLDLFDADIENAWRYGVFFKQADEAMQAMSDTYRSKAKSIIDALEAGEEPEPGLLEEVNAACAQMVAWVKQQTAELMAQGKMVGLVGGDHSTPLGYLQAQAEAHPEGFGVLHIDAHFDLRDAYEGFTYSHASIFFNALKIPALHKLISVGIRDFCEAEVELIVNSNGRAEVYYDHQISDALSEGRTWASMVDEIVGKLPQKVYISFDIDGLDPALCPGTGTPVAGGLQFRPTQYLFKKIVESGRQIIGFDLVEVGIDSEWDGNVGARMLYKMANLMALSNSPNR